MNNPRAALLRVPERRNIPFTDVEMRSEGDALHFRGYASMTERAYTVTDRLGEYTETVKRGAFTKTLADNADVFLLVDHQGMPLARTKSKTMTLTEDRSGLLTDAPDLDAANPVVQSVRSAIDRGDLDQMSMAFQAVRQSWSKAYDERSLEEVSLHQGDVSIVKAAANGDTAGTTSLRDLQAAYAQLHDGKSLSAREISRLLAMHDRREMTFDDIRQTVEDAICDMLVAAGVDVSDYYCWVQDLTAEWAVYTDPQGDLKQVTYTTDDNGTVTLGTPVEVQRVTTYRPEPPDGTPPPAETKSSLTLLEMRARTRALAAR